MRLALTCFLIAAPALSATLTITPPVIFDCQDGAGVAQLDWTGATAPVQIRLVQPDGPPMTGFGDVSGSATTGPWVTDALKFLLVDQNGAVQASAIARVSCGGTVRTIDSGLESGSYFPLQVGNTWIYKDRSRQITDSYVVRSIRSTETIAGKTYFVLWQDDEVLARLRGDDHGVIWIRTADGEQVYLDPKSSTLQKTSYTGPLGDFGDALPSNSIFNSIESETLVFARGIGLVKVTDELISGAVGFLRDLELVEVRLPGARLSLPAPSINLSIETADLDVTGKRVPNCALPCYAVECGLTTPQPDPAGTYRPCTQARIEAFTSPGARVELQLLDPAGTSVFTSSATARSDGVSLRYVRVPVYTAQPASINFTILPPGEYRLTGRVLDAGKEIASSSLSLLVR